jgi:hypothetical protein
MSIAYFKNKDFCSNQKDLKCLIELVIFYVEKM